ncbi:Vms1p KNAG_0H01130 [Huiozyma naganishii CBS 8797]|uniref:VLRF1 domain-containing protein n=1 Tax=Huiozyma naganishii (strain ATCC MYA-139 / BCRC 22969 / CBS 8797 / KCTC 17520 / NBRC 10181 / NCYC 3082 / Yp74L-3) TaxID=1071383 RepID=J7S9J3_HUIN7|nr:hypothetical protein KNAG_0H01130 [Kazachstania naganishii CBS 8797]CCK71526.1 hypothetical protein KNAG_0H01130 [Kazachstania naganishii CBS 8797]
MSVAQFKKIDTYVYDLSNEVLDSLQLTGFDENFKELAIETNLPLVAQNEQDKASQVLPPDQLERLKTKPISTKLHCTVCDLDFADLVNQRAHYQTNIHIHNLKRKISGLEAVTESDVIASDSSQDDQAPSDVSDIEEEETESDDSDDQITETLTQMNITQTETGEAFPLSPHLNTMSPQIYFNTKLLAETNKAFGVYKVLFDKSELLRPDLALRNWNKTVDQSVSMSALFMVGGGHFAGAIVSHQRNNVKGNASKQNISFEEQGVNFLEQKTFHRYTTRRKQGGSQSAMDNAKGKAHSAGSTLRRYNEAALKVDVQTLLKTWEPYLKQCENIFIRARSVTDRKIFYDNGVLEKNDPRLKTFPFTTSRPTATELKKAWCELTYLKVSEKPAAVEPKKFSKQVPSAQKVKTPEPEKTLSPEETHTKELIQLVKKGRAPLIIAYLKRHNLTVDFSLQPAFTYAITPTLLHCASQQGLKQMVTILMTNMKADPTIKNNKGKTAWDLSQNVAVQRCFQIARQTLGEDYKNWDESHIGEPLTREQVEELNKREKEMEENENAALIERELKASKERQQQEKDAARGPGYKLDPAANISETERNFNSLTEDQKRRLMREQRARAAEARMKQVK